MDRDGPLISIYRVEDFWSEHNTSVSQLTSHSLKVGWVWPSERASLRTCLVVKSSPAHYICLACSLASSHDKSEFAFKSFNKQCQSFFSLLTRRQICLSRRSLKSSSVFHSTTHRIWDCKASWLRSTSNPHVWIIVPRHSASGHFSNPCSGYFRTNRTLVKLVTVAGSFEVTVYTVSVERMEVVTVA